ncbi:MAG: hypothetical protein JNL60_13325 [Bacteroidia bacterium]|nr:hypothetical protein [Bacteroidia bacterium]
MKLSEIKQHLQTANSVNFKLPNGNFVPEHFHVTEIGVIDKHFIDCGGTVRKERIINFQLWEANDFEHRLKPQKLKNIINLSEKTLGIEDLEVEVEYQGVTIEKYGLGYDGENFLLTSKQTDCLAPDKCGIPIEKQKLKLADLNPNSKQSCCTPGGNCC